MIPAAFRTHDLLRINPDPALLCFEPEATASTAHALTLLAETPWVVVRRAVTALPGIAVGIRGATRAERYAATLAPGGILDCVSPPSLARRPASRDLPAFRTLRALAACWAGLPYAWGPTGSVGFELATGAPAVHLHSDLDLTLRVDQPLPQAEARKLLAECAAHGVATDVQLETPMGAISLVEYVRSPGLCLLRSAEGPRLVTHPWAAADEGDAR